MFMIERLPNIRMGKGFTIPMRPAANIYEFRDRVEVQLDMPGIRKESLRLQVKDRLLEVDAERDSGDRAHLILNEIKPVRYFRTFELGTDLDSDHITAEYYHGVLTIRIPKKENVIREIEIK